ncbi:MAG: hypothetical protein EXS37_14710 [Opitutus sp.]|nr:hypothetical protein [Opitutus sp.]
MHSISVPIPAPRLSPSGRSRPALVFLILAVGNPIHAPAAEDATPDFFGVVRRFADAMIDRSRTNLSEPKSPLFPIVLTRDTYEIPKGNVQNLVTARVPQEFKNIANPHHDQNLYQILYALSKLTGDARYAAEADTVLRHFLRNCQDTRYGFYAWGEHLGWDFAKNAPGGFPAQNSGSASIHEFYRPWIFWGKSFELAPDSALRFARALWKHQINHQGTISWSRHAYLLKDEPSRRGFEFPRHGGFYIATWAEAFRRTGDPEMLQAIDAVVGYFESHRDPKTGVIPHYSGLEYDRSGKELLTVYSPSNVSLAVDLHDAARSMPEASKQRMLDLARSIDRSIMALPHDPGPGGKGFVLFARADATEPVDLWRNPKDPMNGLPPVRIAYSGGWRTAYRGQQPHVRIMPALIARHRQNDSPDYRRLILACADNYVTAAPDFAPEIETAKTAGRSPDVEAGTIGNVMVVLNAAFKISGDSKYLNRAEWFGAWAVQNFWPDASPLPRASVREDVYSAPSRSDTLVMALLHTWLLRNQPERERDVSLIPTDRS